MLTAELRATAIALLMAHLFPPTRQRSEAMYRGALDLLSSADRAIPANPYAQFTREAAEFDAGAREARDLVRRLGERLKQREAA